MQNIQVCGCTLATLNHNTRKFYRGVEFKQTAKSSWYVGSVKMGADSVEELDKGIDSTVTFLHTKMDKMNKGDFKPAAPLSSISIELNYEDSQLFEKLQSMRTDLSRAEILPPYVVANDSIAMW